MKRHATTAALIAALALAGCAPAEPPPSSTPPVPSEGAAPPATPSSPSSSPPATPGGADTPRDVATGLEAPWSIATHGDVVLISERDSARIRQLLPDGALREVGVVPRVVHGGEGGLLGLAFDDDRRLYAYSTGPRGNRIERFALAGDESALRLGAAEPILDGLPSGPNHNGGRIAFGPDGMLYATVGDAGDPSLARDAASLGGKILRMTPDGDPAPGNPDPASLVYSLGHRNVQGIAWSSDGTMFATEFGQNTWDELNRIVPGGDYGWPDVEGAGGTARGLVDPLQQWPTSDASPSGMAIVDDVILIANLRGERLRAVTVATPQSAADLHVGSFGRLRDVAAAPDGGLWLLTNNTDGRGDPRDGDDRIVRVPRPW